MPLSLEPAQKSQHATWLEIRTDHLLNNLRTLRQHSNSSQVLAVVKANAYGHGLLPIARALAGEVNFLGVSSPAEALELKEQRIDTPLLIFGRLFASEIPPLLADGVRLSVSSLEEAEEISACSKSLSRKTPVHVKVDTGMGRLGIPFRDALRKIEKMAELADIYLEGIYTHFPTAEREDGFTESQLRDFGLLLQALDAKGIQFPIRHAANSAASLKWQTPLLNMIRPGLMLYGLYPDDSLRDRALVSPILSLKSRILLTKHLKPGESAGYGRTFVAEESTTIAILPIGYSHGYPFSASGRSWVLYRGKRYPIAGRVSMDYLCVDLGITATAKAGEEVTLIGRDGEDSIGAEELAEWSGTIPYEIVTRLIPRLPRIYRAT